MIQTVRLQNGLRIVAEKVPAVRSISFGIWVHNGSRFEKPEFAGISHFIEHMLFKGTKRHSAKDIAEKLDTLGGQINAFTSKEYTCYYTRTLDTHFDTALDVLSDMFFNSKFDEEDIKKECNVIIEEISMYEDSPEDLVSDLLHRSIWEDSLGQPILGTKESISSFTKETFMSFMNERYYPENTVIAISGNFDMDDMVKKIESAFSGFKNNSSEKEFNFDTKYKRAVISKEKDIEQMHIINAFPSIGSGHEDTYNLSVLNTILGGGMSSRLFQNIREDQGLAYSVYSFASPHKNAGVFSIYAAINKSHYERYIESVIAEIKKLKTDRITEEQLKNVKEQIKSSYLLSRESTSSRMNFIGRSEIVLGKIRTEEEVVNLIDAVTIDGMYNLIDTIFNIDNMSISAVGDISGVDFNAL